MSISEPASGHTLAIAGVGLLGGSIAAAAKQRGLARRVIGIGRNPKHLQAAVDAGLIDSFVTDPADCDAEWNFAIVATPVHRIADEVHRIAAASRRGTLITDVGSVKADVCRAAAQGLPDGIHFVGSHPLAGSEKNGCEFSDARLFEGRVTIVTPLDSSQDEAADSVTEFWTALGSIVHRLDVVTHDRVLAMTSHLPHIAAAALASILTAELRPFAATGFGDTTRIAAGNPDLWVSILLSNADAVVGSLDGFSQQFEQFREAVRNRDGERLKTLLQLAKTARDTLD
ncbi:MAG: prephenate dehydrogenase [Planctomycetaceae bacterium]